MQGLWTSQYWVQDVCDGVTSDIGVPLLEGVHVEGGRRIDRVEVDVQRRVCC